MSTWPRRASADSHGVGGWSRCGTSVLVPSRPRALAQLAEDELGGQLVTRHPQPVRGRAARSGAAAPAWTASAPTTASAPDSPSGNLGTGSISIVLAGVILSMIPAVVVFLFGQRYLREGLTAGSSK